MRQGQEDYPSERWLRLMGKREIAAIRKSARRQYCAKKVEPKEEKRVKKLLYLEDPKRIQVPGREREKQQRLT